MPQISQDVLKVLDAATIKGALLTLNGNLDRKLYTDTNKVIEAAGGKWNKKAKAHVFDGEAIDAVEPIILTGEYRLTKQDFGQFDTPELLAEQVVDIADVQAGMAILEPSAGIGRIASAVRRVGAFVTCWEIDEKRAAKLQPVAHSLNVGNFLEAEPAPVFDRVVMNPPFAKQDDIRHVSHAFRFLRPGGLLVAIMSNSVMFRDNKLTTEFRDFVNAHGGTFEPLPEGSFKSSGTGVNTCVVTMVAD
jgi:predicted RNA methylase